jgi:hypothetical protein
VGCAARASANLTSPEEREKSDAFSEGDYWLQLPGFVKCTSARPAAVSIPYFFSLSGASCFFSFATCAEDFFLWEATRLFNLAMSAFASFLCAENCFFNLASARFNSEIRPAFFVVDFFFLDFAMIISIRIGKEQPERAWNASCLLPQHGTLQA